jgi:hypothetical protein
MKRLIITFIFILIGRVLFSQSFDFLKLLRGIDTNIVLNDIFPTDSCYYFSGSAGQPGIEIYTIFGCLNLDGNLKFVKKIKDSEGEQMTGFSKTEIVKNWNGNLLLCFALESNIDLEYRRIKLVELTFNGTIIQDTVLNYLCNDFISIEGGNAELINNFKDSTYLIGFSYAYMSDLDTTSSKPNESGVLIIKLDESFKVKWQNFFPTYDPNKRRIRNLQQFNDSTILFAYVDHLTTGNSSFTGFYFLKRDGTILKNKIFKPTTHAMSDPGLLILHNPLRYILTNRESKQVGFDFCAVPKLYCLDSLFKPVWNDIISPYYSPVQNGAEYVHDFVSDDSSLIYAYQYFDNVENITYNSVRYSKRKISNGEIEWSRDYIYPLYANNETDYFIYDIEKTNDSGYICVGQVINYDYLKQNKSGQHGYMLKVNCLGFIGKPEASLTYKLNENHEIVLYNKSINYSKAYWDFGDGSFQQTDMSTDSIVHTYTTYGMKSLRLIVEGCGKERDTINFQIDIDKTNDDEIDENPIIPINPIETILVYPNPIIKGQDIVLYVGEVDTNNSEIIIYNTEGKTVINFIVHSKETHYIIPNNLAQGAYLIRLKQNGKKDEIFRFEVF